MKLNLTLLILFALTIFGCTETDENTEKKITVVNDMEGYNCWTDIKSIAKTSAKSGNYACKLDTSVEFSFGYINKLSNISKELPKKVRVNLFTFTSKPGIKASLVLQIDSANGKSVYWQSRCLDSYLMIQDKWNEVNETFDIPKNSNPNHTIRIYVWNNLKKEFLFDDLKIDFIY